MQNPVITGRAWAALDMLGRWYDTDAQAQAIIEQVRQEAGKPHAKVTLPEVKDYAASIHALVVDIIDQHQFRLHKARTDGERKLHADAIAAWKQTLRTRNREELRRRLEIAVDASGKLYPRVLEYQRYRLQEEWEE